VKSGIAAIRPASMRRRYPDARSRSGGEPVTVR
jgi:hypothetical protein